MTRIRVWAGSIKKYATENWASDFRSHKIISFCTSEEFRTLEESLLNLKWIDVLKELPHEYVPPNMLQKVAMRGDTNKLYATEISRYT